MPLYEYRCEQCGVFDQWRSLAESGSPACCPTCQQSSQRIFSAPAILSGSLRIKRENPHPELIRRSQEPQAPRVQNHSGSRPWMIGH